MIAMQFYIIGLYSTNFWPQMIAMKDISIRVDWNEKYNLCMIYSSYQTQRWYSYESYSLETYAAKVSDWYRIYDDIGSIMKKLGFVFGATAGTTVTHIVKEAVKKYGLMEIIKKASPYLTAASIAIEIFSFIINSKNENLEKTLRGRDLDSWLIINVSLTYTLGGLFIFEPINQTLMKDFICN